MWQDIALTPIENLVNRVLAEDPAALNRLQALKGRCLVIEVNDFKQALSITVTEQGLQLDPGKKEHADVCVRGSSVQLARMLYRQKNPQVNLSYQVQLHGQVDVLEQLQRLLHSLDIDWEALLSRHIGDVGAHTALSGVSRLRRIAKHVLGSWWRQTTAYATYDGELVLDQAALADFSEQVQCLRNDVDRCERRLQRLERARGADQ